MAAMGALAALGRVGTGVLVGALMIFPLLLVTVEGADPAQLVTNLPGAPPGLNFTQYAGYVTVNETNGRALFYWFFTAEGPNPTSKPLVVWFNGGPGCSSVGNGLLAELGPFYPAGDLNNIYLELNNYTWIKEANIIFLESPVSVGFSYSNTSADYDLFTDSRTAEDALQFLLNWYKKFPEYKTNDFYLAGESYAGHYVPTLAREIELYNDAQGLNDFHINFKGWAVGNPWTDAYYNNFGAADWWYTHDLISGVAHAGIIKNCDFKLDRPVIYGDPSPLCNAAVAETVTDLNFLDTYNIYAPICNSIPVNNTLATRRRAKERAIGFLRADSSTPNPCAPDLVTAYLNLPEVQQAIHVEPTQWFGCSTPAFENYSTPDILASMLPIYTESMVRGLRIWIFHGDVDGVCPTTTTRYALDSLKLETKTSWYPWQHDTQVGGFTNIYANLTFATVRDSGHFVPFDQPSRALSLFIHFLAGSPLPAFP
ncbi:unnamed protein product [Calypogeia fissa]